MLVRDKHISSMFSLPAWVECNWQQENWHSGNGSFYPYLTCYWKSRQWCYPWFLFAGALFCFVISRIDWSCLWQMVKWHWGSRMFTSVPKWCEIKWYQQVYGWVQDCSISMAFGMQILQSCTKQSILYYRKYPQDSRFVRSFFSLYWYSLFICLIPFYDCDITLIPLCPH